MLAATSVRAADPPPAAAAQPAAAPVSPPSSVVKGYGYQPEYFTVLWGKRRQAINKGDFMGADRLLEELVASKQRSGFPDMFAYAEAVAWESRALGAAGDWKRALDLGQASAELGPHRLNTHLAVASARWALGDWKGSLQQLRLGLRLILDEPPYRLARLGNLLMALMAALVVTSLAYAFALIYRHLAALWHDVGHLLPVGSWWWQYALVMLALVAWPILFRCGVVGTVAWWMLLLVPYQRGGERWAGALVLGGLLAVTLALPTLTAYIAYPHSHAEALYLAARDMDAGDAAAMLERDDPPAPETLFALGLRARWLGDAPKSRALLEKAQSAGMAGEELQIALANAHYLAGDFAGAEHMFAEQVTAQPRNLMAVFNLGAARTMVNDASGAAESRQRANDLDANTTARWAAITQRTGLAIMEPLVPQRVLATTFDPGPEHVRAADQLWRSMGGLLPRMAVAGLLVLAILWTLVMAVLGLVGKQLGRWSGSCLRCGDAACQRCVPHLPNVERCITCTEALPDEALNNPQDEAGQALRIRKEIDSHRYHARLLKTQRLFNVLLAGAGHLLRGSPWRGIMLMLAFVTCGFTVFQGMGLVPEPLPSYHGFAGLFTVGHCVLLIALYTVAVLDGRHEES